MPRNKETIQKIKDQRREQILATALELFATKGLAATKISDISTKTGISQGLIYHYYQSKEEIFIKLITKAIETMNNAALELENLPVSAKDKIIIAAEALMKGFENEKNTANYYFLITQTAMSESFPEEAKKIIKSKNNVKYEVIKRIFEDGQRDKTIKKFDSGEMATLFFSSINGLAFNKAINGSTFKMPEKKIFLSMFIQDVEL